MPKLRTIVINEKFGKLTALETTAEKKILCLCDCGRQLSVLKSNLTTGKSQSCGKGKCQSGFKDLTGVIKENYIVIELSGSDSDHGTLWKCLCNCGKEFITRGNSIRNGHTRSCGCAAPLINSKRLSLPEGEANVRQIYSNYKGGAKTRELDFNLTLDEFRKYLFNKCYYCGSEPSRLHVVKNLQQNNSILYNGIDRVNNDLGYVIENCVSCCKICNYAKQNLTYLEFIKWIDNLVNYRKNLVGETIIRHMENVK